MSLKSFISAIGIGSALLLSSTLLTDCTSMITEEQLAELQDLRRQERSLREEIANVNSNISKIEAELRARKSELDDCNEEKKFVQDKLSQWPNVWPDWTPGQENEA
ncbi:MAG: hypothetical protein ACOC4D_01050, partial [Bacteroidota bacterium]